MPYIEDQVNHVDIAKSFGKVSVQDARDIVSQLSLHEKVFLLSGSSFTRTSGLPKFGLHPVKTSDGPTDVRGDSVFNAPPSIVVPNATCLGSTWDLDLIEQLGGLLGEESILKSTDILLAPNLNLHRDPRGGRNQESFGEDPFLAGHCGAAFAKGVQSRGVATCPKHLVCNDSETERRFYDVQVDERTLREIYLRPFEIAVKEAKPKAIMTAYNKINGASAAQNEHTMGIVRNEWGFDGLFMSDWFGTYDGPASIKAGLDIEMPFPAARGPRILEAIAKGTLTEEDLDGPAMRTINFLRELKAPADTVRPADKPSVPLPEHVALNRKAAAEGMVLLANPDNLLPLDSTSTASLAIIGSLATDRTLTSLICPSYLVNALEGISSAVPDPSRIRFARGLQTHKVVPKLDKRYTNKVEFKKWNLGERKSGGKPVAVDVYAEALDAILLRPIPGLDHVFENELVATVKVPQTGTYTLSVIAASDAEVFINGESVFRYSPETVVDIQKFLFHSHEIAKTLDYHFEEGREYQLSVVSQSQPQSGPEPVAQGLIFGMVDKVTREETLAEAVEVARNAHTVVVFVGTTAEWEMEGVDRKDIKLPCGQDELIKAVMAVNPRTIVVNQSGSAVDLSAAEGATIVHGHFAGQEFGNAIADLLFGKVVPSGRTTFTWPREIEDSPSRGNFPCTAELDLQYSEGMEMGYRGYLKREREPAFAFGHGLSYTTFDVEEIQIPSLIDSNNSITISAKVTNTGTRAGREVLQVYVNRVHGEDAVQTLEGFAKTAELQSGQAETIDVQLGRRAFSKWDAARSQWVVEKGEYSVQLGRSCVDIVSSQIVIVEQTTYWSGL